MVVKLSGCFRPVIFGPGVKVASLGFSGEAGIFWICWFPHGILINYMQFWCVYKCIPASSKGFCLDPRDGVWAPLIIHSAPFGRSRYIYIYLCIYNTWFCVWYWVLTRSWHRVRWGKQQNNQQDHGTQSLAWNHTTRWRDVPNVLHVKTNQWN